MRRSARRCSSARAARSSDGRGGRRTAAIARLKLKLQLYCGGEVAIGPGKADLLEAIAHEGSISAAARTLGMSYRRGWMLVDTMNRCFAVPLVETRPGGGRRAGARLTPAGEQAVEAYRALSDEVVRGADSRARAALEEAIPEEPLPAAP